MNGMLKDVWFCLICQEPVEAHWIQVSENPARRNGKIMMLVGLICCFLPVHWFLEVALIAGGFLTWIVGLFGSPEGRLICPLCNRSDMIPATSPAATKAWDAAMEESAARQPAPMPISRDFKVTPPAKWGARPMAGKVTIRKLR